ncbi:WD40 repeat-like protein [Hortaea werneckii]|nr:WD40 repeat-like protein [Hortaea werneckii]
MASVEQASTAAMAKHHPGEAEPSRSTRQQQQPTPNDEEGVDMRDYDEEEHDQGELCRHDHDHERLRNRYRKDVSDGEHNISIPASSKHAEQTVAPFLSEHIPMQYNPVGGHHAPMHNQHAFHQQPADDSVYHHDPSPPQDRTNTKFCYRHRPDLKCRRQANEPSMEQLQNELASLSQSDQQAISHVWSLFSAAPAKHRNLMLQGILTQCCFPQLSFISASVRDLIKIDFLSALPPELGFKILCYLDTTSLCKAAQVSQRWRSLADDDVVWHKMCEQHIDRKCTKCGWGLPLLERKRLRCEKRQIQLRAMGRGENSWSPAITPVPEELPVSAVQSGAGEGSSAGVKRSLESGPPSPVSVKRLCSRPVPTSGEEAPRSGEGEVGHFEPKRRPWKDVYKDRFKVGTAWKYGRCSTKVFKGHSNGVMCVQFDENVLITGSYDSTVKVWDIHTGQTLRTLTGHTSGIRCLQFDDNKLMTGSLDSTLRLWNWRTGQCLRTFQAHNEGILTLHFNGLRFVATGSMDKTIRVWDSENKQTFLLRGHTDWVNCVKVDEASRTLFSASDDLTVRLWDLDSRECIKVFEGHVGQVQQIVPLPAEFELDEEVASGVAKGDDENDDTSSVSSAAESLRRDSPVPAPTAKIPFWPNDDDRPAPPRYMLTGALDSTIRLWNVHSSPSLHPLTDPNTHNPIKDPHHPPEGATSSSHNSLIQLPTDPLTNSHTPRAASCLRTFFGHVEGIWALAADHLRLVSGSEDRMMKVWDPRTGKCERTFTGHAGPITCCWLSDWAVASGGEDCEVRMLVFGDR